MPGYNIADYCHCYERNGYSPDSNTGRNLVICIDGTNQKFSEKSTNVVKLYSKLEKDKRQLTYYSSGIGTYAALSKNLSFGKVIGHKLDLAFALRIETIVLAAYRWLSNMYQEGDRIFLFGFSRGAYQVRVLSAMIESVGLIQKGNEDQIPFAYEHYIVQDKNTKTMEKCRSFKEAFSRSIAVHFVGVWDTVSSVGIIQTRNLPKTADGMAHVCAFRHALALDERRVKFLPVFCSGGLGPTSPGDALSSNVKEVWFAGSHSDIGGSSNTVSRAGFGPTLRWMMYQGIIFGIRIRRFESVELVKLKTTNSLNSPWWWFLELVPMKRLSYKAIGSTTRSLHLGALRKTHEGQKIHESVYDYDEHWILSDTGTPDLDFEPDPYSAALEIKEILTNEPSSLPSEDLAILVARKDGLRSLQETPEIDNILFDALTSITQSGDYAYRQVPEIIPVIMKTLLALGGPMKIHRRPHSEILNFAKRLLESEPKNNPSPYLTIAQQFLRSFATAELHASAPKKHADWVRSVAFSPDSKEIASGSDDRTVRVWNVDTGKLLYSFAGHTDRVVAVVFSPDGSKIVSGSEDKTVRVWPWEIERSKDGNSNSEVVLKGHQDYVNSVAFSRSEEIASGSGDGTIRIWSIQCSEEGRKERNWKLKNTLEGHTTYILSVAFSADGKKLVSGSVDGTVRVWDVEHGRTLESIKGRNIAVKSVVFSPNVDRVIAFGSENGMIRLFDYYEKVQTKLLDANDGSTVNSVAFSPDGKTVASGHSSSLIRLWDVDTGELKAENFFRGHEGGVLSVAFGSGVTEDESLKLVSGSMDCTVRVWDATVLKGEWEALALK